MFFSKRVQVTGIAALLVLAMFAGCDQSASPDSPKQAVIAMFGAMQDGDKAALAHLLDLGELARNTQSDYALATDSPRVWTSPEAILNDLTQGETKERWFSMQRIVNDTKMLSDDNALVEVTFHDKTTNKAYLTHFGVHKMNDKWRIYSFKVLDQSGN